MQSKTFTLLYPADISIFSRLLLISTLRKLLIFHGSLSYEEEFQSTNAAFCEMNVLGIISLEELRFLLSQVDEYDRYLHEGFSISSYTDMKDYLDRQISAIKEEFPNGIFN